MSKEDYTAKLASPRWFLVANAVAVAGVLLAWFIAYGAMSVINQQIPVRARPVAAFPIVLWIAWWFLTRVGRLWRGETFSEHDVWPRSRAWAVTGWIAVGASILFAGILVVAYRH
jgi:hypothetical protein